MSALVDRAESLARRSRTAMFGRTFERGVSEFSALLSAVPDGEAGDTTPADVDRLVAVAGEVVATIEGRLESNRDSQAVRLRLADAVYQIRAELEQLALWRRHVNG
jgi:hypothetical protein